MPTRTRYRLVSACECVCACKENWTTVGAFILKILCYTFCYKKNKTKKTNIFPLTCFCMFTLLILLRDAVSALRSEAKQTVLLELHSPQTPPPPQVFIKNSSRCYCCCPAALQKLFSPSLYGHSTPPHLPRYLPCVIKLKLVFLKKSFWWETLGTLLKGKYDGVG